MDSKNTNAQQKKKKERKKSSNCYQYLTLIQWIQLPTTYFALFANNSDSSIFKVTKI